ncbi:MAG: hypothetical protein ABEI52_00090, partial [Halobacteriaceae archaeon]
IDLMIGAGRETRGVIDVQDYVSIPSQIGAYHFTPGVVTEMDGNMFDLEFIFEKAAKNTFVPLDVGTSRVAFAIVKAPERMVRDGELTEPEVNSAFRDWKDNHGIEDAAGMATLKPAARAGSDVDVLLLLGGFDLDPLLEHSWDRYEEYRDSLFAAGTNGDARLTESDLQAIEQNLESHKDLNSDS